MSRVIPRADISQEIAEWQGAVYGEEVRTANVQALTKLQEQQNDACDMFEEIAEDFDERDETWAEQMETAEGAATAAAGSAEDAEDSAADSEAYAVGKRNGTDVPTTDPAWHNNSKYYAEQAEDSADAAGTSESAAESAKTAAQTAQAAAEEAAQRASEIVDIDIATTERAGIVKATGDVQVAADGSMSLPNAIKKTAQTLTDSEKAQARENIHSASKDVELAKLSGRNLLDNPWFTVNQRGQSSYSTGVGYTFDRWKVHTPWGTINSTVSKSSGIVTFAVGAQPTYPNSYNRLVQGFENIDSFVGKEVTASIDVTAVNGTATLTLLKTSLSDTSSGIIELATISGVGITKVTFIMPSDFYWFGIEVFQGASISFSSIKLELGSISTLANDSAPNYAEELLKCQSYYYSGKAVYIYETTSQRYVTSQNLPVKMRAEPSISVGENGSIYNILDLTQASTIFQSYGLNGALPYLRCSTTGGVYIADIVATADL